MLHKSEKSANRTFSGEVSRRSGRYRTWSFHSPGLLHCVISRISSTAARIETSRLTSNTPGIGSPFATRYQAWAVSLNHRESAEPGLARRPTPEEPRRPFRSADILRAHNVDAGMFAEQRAKDIVLELLVGQPAQGHACRRASNRSRMPSGGHLDSFDALASQTA